MRKFSITPNRVHFKTRSLRGFTVVEFLVVLIIIVILVIISLGAFQKLQPDFQLSGAIRDLVSDLRYAQQLAVTEQANYCVKFLLLERKYQIIQCSESTLFLEISLPDEITTLTTNGFVDNQVEFNPYGAAIESGTISLENTENKIKIIEIKPSGFVRIAD